MKMNEPGLWGRESHCALEAVAHATSVHSGGRKNSGAWVFGVGFKYI